MDCDHQPQSTTALFGAHQLMSGYDFSRVTMKRSQPFWVVDFGLAPDALFPGATDKSVEVGAQRIKCSDKLFVSRRSIATRPRRCR